MINKTLSALVDYALTNQLIQNSDVTYCINRVLNLIGGDNFEYTDSNFTQTIDQILNSLCDFAFDNNKLSDNTVTFRDILSADIMDCFTPMPSQINSKFFKLYNQSPEKATEYFYNLSKISNYIMTERVKKDIKWTSNTKYGDLIITINLSKPEKDPKDIAAAKSVKQSGYPKCLLCSENVGYEGNANHPPRSNHRIIPLNLNEENWYLQYSPYVYYNEHCILLNSKHTPMVISKNTFDKLLCFVEQFPHYFAGSNADLPIVGGSILTHDHFQGGQADLPMALTNARSTISFNGFENAQGEILNWALSTIRIKSTDKNALSALGDKILCSWREYSDEENQILSITDAPHNTITPIARIRDGQYELDLILRNNRTTQEHPLGIFHPHAEYHHIKKENIGLIEAMGLAVLPARLTKELDLSNEQIRKDIGNIFEKILENCAVFKDDNKGNAGFAKFIDYINNK